MNTTISHHPRSGATSRKGLTWLSALVAGVTMIGSASLQAQVGDTSIVVFPNSGNSVSVAGVKYSGPNTNWPGHNEINHNPITCDSQALSLDLGEEVDSAMATFTAFQASEAGGREEVGQWEAFDAGGLPVGSEKFGGSDSQPIDIDPGEAFRYLVFTALAYDDGACPLSPIINDSSDYYLASLSFPTDDPIPGGTKSTNCGSASNCTAIDFEEDLGPAGFDFGIEYTANGRFVDAPIIVNTEECEGGTGDNNDNCEIPLSNEIVLNIQNAPDVSGGLTSNGLTVIEDTRDACNGVASATPEELVTGFALGGGEFLTIPAHLCGIPNPDFGGAPTFTIIDVDSDLTVVSSVLEVIDTEEKAGGFECLEGSEILALGTGADMARSMLPVVGYLPKTLKGTIPTNEIPVLDGSGDLVATFQDTTYACGSTRSRRSRFSYTIYDLRHRPDLARADYVDIIGGAIDQLNVTMDQSQDCISGDYYRRANQFAQKATSFYDAGQYQQSKEHFKKLLKRISSESYRAQYNQCLFDLDNRTVFVGDPDAPGEGNVPRNFRGEKITQISHILYMIDRMLGQLHPSLPPEFASTAP